MGKDADRVNTSFVSVRSGTRQRRRCDERLSFRASDPRLGGLTGSPEAVAKAIAEYPRLRQEGSVEGWRLHHGSYRAGLFDGPRRKIRRTVQSQAEAGRSRGRAQTLSLSPRGGRHAVWAPGARQRGDVCAPASPYKRTLASTALGWFIRPTISENFGKASKDRLHRHRPKPASRLRMPRNPACWRCCCSPWGCSPWWPCRKSSAQAQGVSQSGPQAVPGFWDPRRRPDRPDLSRITVIRFLTETDYPPFNFAGPDGNPAGFNVDLARLLCEEIKVTCTIQMRRFEIQLDADCQQPRRCHHRLCWQ